MTKSVKVGNVKIGNGAPVSIQSMCNTKTSDVKASIEQIRRLEEAGCEIIRLTVPDLDSAKALKEIKKKSNIPIVADIHFDYRMAIAAIEAGADKIRINPGNIGSEENVRKVINAAKKSGIPIRVGVNSGSLEKDILNKYGKVTAEGLAESALRNVGILEKFDFDDIVISLKSSNVKINYDAYRIVANKSDYPLHIGVTEAGTPGMGKIKSAAGVGALLLEGIGDTMRISLTADPVEEVIFARKLLEAIGIRGCNVEIVSCPTCGRTEVKLESIASQIESESGKLDAKIKRLGGSNNNGIKIAVMGCAVNGPGEAKGADIGVACGKGEGLLFANGKIVKKVKEERIVSELMQLADKYIENI